MRESEKEIDTEKERERDRRKREKRVGGRETEKERSDLKNDTESSTVYGIK